MCAGNERHGVGSVNGGGGRPRKRKNRLSGHIPYKSAELAHAGFEITSDVACVVHELLCPGLGLLAKDVG